MIFTEYLESHKFVYTGRGSTAIYLALRTNHVRGAKVLVPANICYAAVLPIIYSGNEPLFADVGDDGNLTCKTVTAVRDTNIKAAIIPHMYGNPCQEVAAICTLLHTRGAIVIEDCASAMGADLGGVMTGTFGDYTVYSFGYAKTIDCGYGGLLVSRHRLDDVAELNAELPLYTPTIDVELRLLSNVYRVLRNHPTGVLTEAVYECMRQRLQHCFLFRAPTEHINRISANLGHLQEIILQRRTNSGLYERYLNWGATLKLYCFHPGAVPWRYNILVDEAHKPRLTKQLLQQQLAVSDWYPVIAPVFGVKETFPQAYRMEKQLLNFPLVDVTKDQIQRIAQEINRFFAAT